MKQYIEITLLSNPDINLFSLWSTVYQQLHLALVEVQDPQKKVPIGVAFPEYVVGEKSSVLGSKCRLFAPDQAALERLDIPKWLARLMDYVHITSIRPVPDKITAYACYQRYQPKSNALRLARRYANRHAIDLDTAFSGPIQPRPAADGTSAAPFRYCELPRQTVNLPFIRLNSLSNGQSFRLWIKKSVVPSATVGTFSTYGLSSRSSVPEF